MPGTVLIISDHFPPDPRVGGLRPGMFAKYLPEFGWQVWVLTRASGEEDSAGPMRFTGLPAEERVVRVRHTYQDAQRAAREARWRDLPGRILRPEAAYPAGLLDGMAPALWSLLDRAPVDVILATSPVDVPLRLADMARRARGIPWVADFRDIIEQDMDRKDGLKNRLSRQRWRARRGWLLRTSSAVSAASDYYAQVLARQTSRPVTVLPNGFDPEMWNVTPLREIPQFRVVYAGRLLSTYYREPRPLFEALDRFLESPGVDPGRVEVLFYGTEKALLGELLAPYACRRVVRAMDRVAYEDTPRLLTSGCILLTLTNRGRKGVLASKVFEYLAARRPVLCVPGDGADLDRLLVETGAGCSLSNPDAILDQLRAWYREWRATGTVQWMGRADVIAGFSRREQARQMASLLERVALQGNARHSQREDNEPCEAGRKQ
ncbi:MAG: glycosyltransferase [Kiritimatiellae bacterium]|nr:glycosyltransferase [Kiritimatiellia bacterium]